MLPSGYKLHGRYVIEKVLGEGGMGAVYMARQDRIGGKRVAIKEMMVDLHDPQARDRAIAQFHKEAEILSSLDHLGLTRVLGHFVEGGAEYLVMEYVDGQTLDSLFHKQRQFLSVNEVITWIDQLCEVLMYLHEHDPPVIFRDLKPSNIMLDSAGRIRLIDFGIARNFEPDSKTTTFIKGAGTHGFAPVEQYGTGTTDARSDVYALGATMYVLLTRSLPPASIAIMSGEERLWHPTQYNPAIPQAIDAVIMKCMSIRKEDRYQSIDQVRGALDQAWIQSTAMTMTSRFCHKCFAGLEPDTPFCRMCGSDTRADSGTASPPPGPSGNGAKRPDLSQAMTQLPGERPPPHPEPAPARPQPAPERAPMTSTFSMPPTEAPRSPDSGGRLDSGIHRLDSGIHKAPPFKPPARDSSSFARANPTLPSAPPPAAARPPALPSLPLPTAPKAEDSAVMNRPPTLPQGPPSLPSAPRPAGNSTPAVRLAPRQVPGESHTLMVTSKGRSDKPPAAERPSASSSRTFTEEEPTLSPVPRTRHAPPIDVPVRKKPTSWRVVAAAVAIVVLVIGLLVMLSNSGPKPVGQAGTGPSVTIRSEPAGANIFVDDKSVGVTPLVWPMAEGPHTIKLDAAGYQTWLTNINVPHDAVVQAQLVAATNALVVNVKPDDVTIQTDGTVVTPHITSPGRLVLSPGSHTLVITKDGYQARTVQVDISASTAPSPIDVELQPVAQAQQQTTVEIESVPPGANVFVDDKNVGQTPYRSTDVVVGKHTIRLELAGYCTVTQDKEVREHDITRVEDELKKVAP